MHDKCRFKENAKDYNTHRNGREEFLRRSNEI